MLPWLDGFFSWSDGIEIVFFSMIWYTALLWLKKDRTRNLLYPVFTYLVVLAGSYILPFTTIHYSMIWLAPVACCLLFLVHQRTLQKNFIALWPSYQTSQTDWVEQLIRYLLTTAHHGQQISCIIENKDSVTPWITARYDMQLPVSSTTFELLATHTRHRWDKPIIISSVGTVTGFDTAWTPSSQQQAALSEYDQPTSCTSFCDAIYLHVQPANQHSAPICTVILNGTIREQMPIAHIATLLAKKSRVKLPDQGNAYETHTKTSPRSTVITSVSDQPRV